MAWVIGCALARKAGNRWSYFSVSAGIAPQLGMGWWIQVVGGRRLCCCGWRKSPQPPLRKGAFVFRVPTEQGKSPFLKGDLGGFRRHLDYSTKTETQQTLVVGGGWRHDPGPAFNSEVGHPLQPLGQIPVPFSQELHGGRNEDNSHYRRIQQYGDA